MDKSDSDSSEDEDIQSLPTNAGSNPWDQLENFTSKVKSSSADWNQATVSVPSTGTLSSKKSSLPRPVSNHAQTSGAYTISRVGGKYQLPSTYAASDHDSESVSGASMSDLSMATDATSGQGFGSMATLKRNNTASKEDPVNSSQLIATSTDPDNSIKSAMSDLEWKKDNDGLKSSSVEVDSMFAGLGEQHEKERFEDVVSVAQEEPEKKPEQKRQKWFYCAVTMLSLLMIGATLVAVVAFVTKGSSSTSSSNQDGPTAGGVRGGTTSNDPNPPPVPPPPPISGVDSVASVAPSSSVASLAPSSSLVNETQSTNSPTASPVISAPLPGITSTPSPSPNANPTLAPTPSPVSINPGPTSLPTSTLVLRTGQELQSAIDDYLAGTVMVPINEWDVSGVSDFSQLFSADRNPAAAEFNEDLDKWNTSNAETFERLFQNAKAFNGTIATWDTSQVTNMEKAFEGAESFNGDLSGWQTGSVLTFFALFRGAISFDSAITNWDTSSARNYSHTFSRCLAFNKPLLWDTSNAVDMSRMFRNAEKFNQDLSFDTSGVTNMDGMFRLARSFDGQLNFDTSSVTSMKSMFMDAESFTGGGLSLFDVSRVTMAKQMFAGASSLQGNGLGRWNFRSLENADSMFARIPDFRQSFCGWRSRVPTTTLIVTNMFEGTSCPVTEPDLVSGTSFCTTCNNENDVTAAPGT